MQDVANHAGVSIATVSFVMNGTKRVSEATRAKVAASMDELGYHRNVLARALASQRTHIIALLYPALEHGSGPTTTRFVTHAATAAQERGYDLVVWPINNDANQTSRLIAGGLVDGVVLMEVQLKDPRVETLLAAATPFALIGRTNDDTLPFIDIDYVATIKTAINHLTEQGHTEIVLINETVSSTLPDMGYLVRTGEAYESEMLLRGLQPRMVSCEGTTVAGRQTVRALLEQVPSTTAIVIMNENAAFGVMGGIKEANRAVPQDVSVISLSTSPEVGAQFDPPLTTMNAPAHELAAGGVDALLDQLEGHATASQTLVVCTLTVGQSTGPVRRTT